MKDETFELKQNPYCVNKVDWESHLLPETFNIEIDFNLYFSENIFELRKKDFNIFVYDNFSLRTISKISREYKSEFFKFAFCNNNLDRSLDRLNNLFYRKDSNTCKYGYVFTIEAREEYSSHYFTIDQIKQEAQSFIDQFIPKFFNKPDLLTYVSFTSDLRQKNDKSC